MLACETKTKISFVGMCTYNIPKKMRRVHGVEETNEGFGFV